MIKIWLINSFYNRVFYGLRSYKEINLPSHKHTFTKIDLNGN